MSKPTLYVALVTRMSEATSILGVFSEIQKAEAAAERHCLKLSAYEREKGWYQYEIQDFRLDRASRDNCPLRILHVTEEGLEWETPQ